VAHRLSHLCRGKQPERAKAPGSGDGSGQLRTRQATAHSSLDDRNIKAEPI
jgi:hypothetical protein